MNLLARRRGKEAEAETVGGAKADEGNNLGDVEISLRNDGGVGSHIARVLLSVSEKCWGNVKPPIRVCENRHGSIVSKW